jgi:hypothetical protein
VDATTAVSDHPDELRFVLREDGHEAELTYLLDGPRFTLDHTRVPEELGGRGVGGTLVRAAVERAAADGLVVVPQCPFARRWLEQHPDVAATVTVDWPAPES